MIRKTHNHFLLNPSPWPLVCSFSGFNLLISLLFFLKTGNTLWFFLRFLSISLARFFWWLIYRGECSLEGKFSFHLEDGLKFSIILFISSEVLFFFSFFWAYFHFYLRPILDLGLSWPPEMVLSFDCLNVPLINTLILISSGVTVTLRHHFICGGKKNLFNFFLFLTVVLGAAFTFLQGQEYIRSFFSIRDSTFGTSFFILTGFHGIHVLIGTVFLFTVLLRRILLNSSIKNFLSFELSSWYWHFVDVVWLFLYFSLYYLNA